MQMINSGRLMVSAVACLLLVAHAPSAKAQKTPLVVYTAMESDQIGPYKQAIEAAVPEVDVQWVRDSTGVITARLLAEKANPKADLVVGLAVSSLLAINNAAALLEPYKAAGSEQLKPLFQSKDNLFVGMDAFLGVVCFNTVEGGKVGVAPPKSNQDLLNPALKGRIVMPHPASSGTGYLIIAAWLQTMGEVKGWAFMDALHENIAVYLHSGSAPCVQAARGEYTIGLGFDMRATKEKTNGAPLEIILPMEGAGWDMEASAIVKGTPKLPLARKVMDWIASKQASELYGRYYALVAHPGVNAAPVNYPPNAEAGMAKIDLNKMAADRDAILKTWSARYEGKAAARK